MSSGEQKSLRFAPSPNGRLHLGHALSAFLNHDAAMLNNGRFLLRIEDIDLARARPEFDQAIHDDLDWLGLRYEQPVLRQSDRLAAYRASVEQLERLGLVYPAFLGRRQVLDVVRQEEEKGRNWPRNPDGAPLYPGPERHWSERRRRVEIDSGRPYALRLDMDQCIAALQEPSSSWREAGLSNLDTAITNKADPALWGDAILVPRDAPASYHLSVVVDDHFQSISHVVRGLDLLPATSLHILLHRLLGLTHPTYSHHRLVLDEDGQKLAKSSNSTGLHELRQAGLTPDDVRSLVGVDEALKSEPALSDEVRHDPQPDRHGHDREER